MHPKRILDVMNEPGLSRAHISSHLQVMWNVHNIVGCPIYIYIICSNDPDILLFLWFVLFTRSID